MLLLHPVVILLGRMGCGGLFRCALGLVAEPWYQQGQQLFFVFWLLGLFLCWLSPVAAVACCGDIFTLLLQDSTSASNSEARHSLCGFSSTFARLNEGRADRNRT